MIMAAISIPLVQSTLKDLRLRSAVNIITTAIQSTRYRAIYDGCPYAIAFNNTTNTYQVSSEVTGSACALTMTNVGTPIPFGNLSQVALNQNVSFQFSPGGSVQVIAGAQTFTVNYIGTPELKTVQVTNYGSITVQ